MKRQLTAFKQLVSFISNMKDMRISSEINPLIAQALEVSVKTVETIGKTRMLTSSEILVVVDVLIKIAEDKTDESTFNTRVLYELVWDFLETVIDEKAFIGLILNKYRVFQKNYDETRNIYIKKTYSNRSLDFENLYVKREAFYKKLLNKTDKNQVTFLIGPVNSGKISLVQYFVKKDRENENKFNSYFFFNGGNLELGLILSQMIFAFTGHNLSNYNLDAKKRKVLKYLEAQNSLIVLEDFTRADDNSLKEFIEFFSNTDKLKMIITGHQKERRISSMLNEYDLESDTINITTEFTREEWESFVDQLAENEKYVKTAIEIDPSLVEWCYNLRKKNIFLLGDIIRRISKEIASGSSPEAEKKRFMNTVYSAAGKNDAMEKLYKLLSDEDKINEKMLFVLVSLFQYPVTAKELKKLWKRVEKAYGENMDDEPLESIIEKCRNKLLVESDIDKEKNEECFTVPNPLKMFIKSKLEDDDKLCMDIADIWIDYYIDETKDNLMNTNEDNMKRYDEDSEDENMRISCILEVLEYCEKEQQWERYYNLCRNMKYYLLNRGICGIGENSYHYKRAIAAKRLNNYNKEYEALLYFCIVGSKMRDYTLVDEAFDRLQYINVHVPTLDGRRKCKYNYVRGMYFMTKNEFVAARTFFDDYLMNAEKLLQENLEGEPQYTKLDIEHLKYDIVSVKRWKSDCLCYLAEADSMNAERYLAEAITLLDEAQPLSQEIGKQRGVAHCILIRARINFAAYGLNEITEKYIDELNDVRSDLNQDSYFNSKYKELMRNVAAFRKKEANKEAKKNKRKM